MGWTLLGSGSTSALPITRIHYTEVHAFACIRGISQKTMSLVSPSTQSVQAFVFGLDNDTKPHQHTLAVDPVDDTIDLEGNEMRQSMYVELLDGT